MKPEQLQFGWGCENASVFAQQLVTSLAKDWEVYIKPPFGKPETVLEYLAGYVNRIAISNSRIESVADDKVTFRYRDYRDDGKAKSLTLPVHEFMRRFFLHVLPAGFVRIRYYGLWHSNCRAKLAHCRQQVVKAQLGLDTAILTLWFRPLSEEEKATLSRVWRGAACPHRRVSRHTTATAPSAATASALAD